MSAVALAAIVVVGAAANGHAVSLHRNDVLVVRLAGNPTTGYRWSPTQVPPALRLVSSRYVAPPKQPLGRGGTYVFRFQALGGRGSLRLAYRRPWERGKPPLRTFALTVRAG